MIKNRKTSSARITIGLLINQLDGMYQKPLWVGVADMAEAMDMNLVIYVGKSLRSPLAFEAQQNIIYQMIDTQHLDGIISTSGSLGNDIGITELERFYAPFRSIPMVSISLPIKDMPSIIVDNRQGMHELVEHLVTVHGYRRIALIKGPDTNMEARLRFRAYKDTLKKHHILYDPELVLPGDFRYDSGREAIHILFDIRKRKDVQAIVSSNDDMAVIACDTLKQRGVRVPQDIAVTGFDDIEDVQFYSPPFTTVRQPLYDQAKTACKVLLDAINGKKTPDITKIPAKLVVRQSCGCFPTIDYSRPQTGGIVDSNNVERATAIFDTPTKTRLVREMLAAFNLSVSERKLYKQGLGKILTVINNIGKNPERQNNLLKEINYLLDNSNPNEIIINNWQRNLGLLKQETLARLKNKAQRDMFEGLFGNAELLPSRIMVREEAFRKLDLTRINMSLRELMQTVNTAYTIKDLMKILAKDLFRVGIPQCFISLYDAELESREDGKWILPKTSRLVMAYDEDGPKKIEEKNRFFPTKNLFPSCVTNRTGRQTLIVNALYNRTEHFGFVVYKLGIREEMVYITLREIISNAIQTTYYFERQKYAENRLKKALNELEKLNKELHNISIKDTLTGLYNRRGFFILGEQHYALIRRMGGKFLLIFADLDGLKNINDTYGHREGDRALIGAADILKHTFRKSDIIARFGGDEYVIIAVNDRLVSYKRIYERLNKNIENYNKEFDKSYRVSLSFGVVEFDKDHYAKSDKIPSFEDLISMADKKLYKQKKAKKII